MNVEKTNLENVLLFKPDIFEDHRGEYIETYNERDYTEHIKRLTGEDVHFVVDDMSVSCKRALRGIHRDPWTWKLISCPYGRIYFVVVKCKEDFGKWQSFTLSDRNRCQVLVPPDCGNAHLVMSKEAIFHYKQSQYYKPDRQIGFKWDDPDFNIFWPIRHPILSERDSHYNK